MIIDMETALDHNIIHLTEDNMKSLRIEVSSVRDALLAKHPGEEFPHMMPHLDPERIIPPESLFEEVLGPDPEEHIYGNFGCTVRADRLPYSIFLTKFVGIQLDIETPFIEELLLWVHKINNDEEVNCQNSQWRYNLFQKRRELLKVKLAAMLQKEVMDLIMVSHHCKNGTLQEQTGIFSFFAAMFQQKMIEAGFPT